MKEGVVAELNIWWISSYTLWGELKNDFGHMYTVVKLSIVFAANEIYLDIDITPAFFPRYIAAIITCDHSRQIMLAETINNSVSLSWRSSMSPNIYPLSTHSFRAVYTAIATRSQPSYGQHLDLDRN